MTWEFTVEDEGKRVLTADGVEVGTVHKVRGTRAHVTPADELADRVRARLDWGPAENQVYELTSDAVRTVTAEEVHLDWSV